MENEETISELMADYANGLKFYCKKLHALYVGNNACKNCILSESDEFGEDIICGCSFGEPHDWNTIL